MRRADRLRPLMHLGAASVLGAVLVSALPAFAATLRVDSLARAFDGCSGDFDEEDFFSEGSAGFVGTGGSVGVSGPCAVGSAVTDGVVGPGYFRAGAAIDGDVATGSLAAQTSISMRDDVVIDAPGLAGTPGTATALMEIVASGAFSGEIGGGSFELEIRVAGTGASYRGDYDPPDPWDPVTFVGTGLPPGSHDPSGQVSFVLELPFSFTYGTAFEVSVAGAVGASASYDSPSFAAAGGFVEFPGSFRWLGIEGLADGAQTTQGAIDWIRSAPTPAGEPPLGALAALGAALAAARRARRAGA